jgi:hypothetical protein
VQNRRHYIHLGVTISPCTVYKNFLGNSAPTIGARLSLQSSIALQNVDNAPTSDRLIIHIGEISLSSFQ